MSRDNHRRSNFVIKLLFLNYCDKQHSIQQKKIENTFLNKQKLNSIKYMAALTLNLEAV